MVEEGGRVERGGRAQRSRAVEAGGAQQLRGVGERHGGEAVHVRAADHALARGAAGASGDRDDRELGRPARVLLRPLREQPDRAVQRTAQRRAQRQPERRERVGQQRGGRVERRGGARGQQRGDLAGARVVGDGDHLTGGVAGHRLAADRLGEVEARLEDAARCAAPALVLVDHVAALHHLQGRAERPAAQAEPLDRVGEHELVEGLDAARRRVGRCSRRARSRSRAPAAAPLRRARPRRRGARTPSG